MVKLKGALLLAYSLGEQALAARGTAWKHFNGDRDMPAFNNRVATNPVKRPINMPPYGFTDRVALPGPYQQIYGILGQGAGSSASNCGNVVGDRLMGGSLETIENNPWSVFYLGCQNTALPTRKCFRCGGAIISDRWILTAASCNHATVPIYSGMVLGTANFSDPFGAGVPSAYWADVEAIVKHEWYDARSRLNDIAAVATVNPLTMSDKVYPICLPKYDVCLESGTLVEVMGYGDTDANTDGPRYQGAEYNVPTTLQVAKLPIVRYNVCKRYHNSPHFSKKQKRFVRKWNICAGDSSTVRTHICDGDGGGPMVYKDFNGVAQLIGIASYGFGCKDFGQVAIYSRMTSYIEWVVNATGVLNDGGTGDSTCVDQYENIGAGAAFGASTDAPMLSNNKNQISGHMFLQSFCAWVPNFNAGTAVSFRGPSKCADLNKEYHQWTFTATGWIKNVANTMCWSVDTVGLADSAFPVTVTIEACSGTDMKQKFHWTNTTGTLTVDENAGDADKWMVFYKDGPVQMVSRSWQRHTIWFNQPNADHQILTSDKQMSVQYCALKEGGWKFKRFQKIKFFKMTDARCAAKKRMTRWTIDGREAVAGKDAVVIKDWDTKTWCWNMNPRASKPQPVYIHKCRAYNNSGVNKGMVATYGYYVKGDNWWQRFVWSSPTNGIVRSQVNLNNVGGGGAGNAFLWFNRLNNVNNNKKKGSGPFDLTALGRRWFPYTPFVGSYMM